MSSDPKVKFIVGKIKTGFSEKFGNRIVCLIHHGSSVYQEINSPISDIDLELVLDRHEQGDYRLVREIISDKEIKVECQLRYLNELTNSDGLINRSSYKIFMFFAYANGTCLIGNNFYKKLSGELEPKEVIRSLLISAQIAYKDIRKMYLAKEDTLVVKKQVKIFIVDLLIALKVLDYQNLGKNKFFENININCLDSSIRKKIILLLDWVKDTKKNPVSDDIFVLVDLVYKYFFDKNEKG